MKDVLYYFVILLYFIVFVLNVIRIKIVHKWINNHITAKDSVSNKITSKRIYLLIPLFNEQNIIEDTYNHFLSISSQFENVYTVFITTNKEDSKVTTYEMLYNIMQTKPCTKILHFHYPLKNGVMAHQLNYAVQQLDSMKIGKEPYWIGIYNADSRISANTINYVLSNIDDNANNYCFQQYSWYRNPTTKNKSILGSASLWQIRWSICFEFYRVLYQSFLNKYFPVFSSNIFLERMNYVIGHGLFISNSDLNKLGGFPENTINEDAFLGMKINCKRIQIRPIPYLEEADFAKKISVYIKQQTVWFNGPLYAFSYYKLMVNEENNLSPKSKCRYLFLAFKLFLHAVYWISGAFCLFAIPILCFKKIWQLVLWIMIVILELPLTHYLVRRLLIKLNVDPNSIATPSILYCLILYILHCIGPLRGIILKLIGKNTQRDKYKTER